MNLLSKDKSDAILINYWFGYNYGASLVAYALQKNLANHNIKTKTFNYVSPSFKNLYPDSFSQKFGEKHLNLTKRLNSIANLDELNKLTNTFITGSDQVFNYLIYNTLGGNAYQLNFADNNKKKISCAASLAFPYYIGGKAQTIIFKTLLERFNSISVREKNAQHALLNQFNIKSDIICDPVFSISKDE